MKIAQVFFPALLALLLGACDHHSDHDGHDHGEAGHSDHGHDHDDDHDDHHDSDHGDEHEDEDEHGDDHATEDHTEIAAAVAEETGIETAIAGPGVIVDEHAVQGLLTPIEGRVAKVTARFPGPIRKLHVAVGDNVRAGQPLASIESNMSLTEYTVTAPISGVVLSRDAALGQIATDSTQLFEIADLSKLWVDLHIFGSDAEHIGAGAGVTVSRMSDGVSIDTVLDRVLPAMATASQSTVARATIANTDGYWRPGAAVRARVTVDRQTVDLLVPLSALQRWRDQDVVFVRTGETYTARPVMLGRRDNQRVQILSGLQAGEEIVVKQSYLLKADLDKSGATHSH